METKFVENESHMHRFAKELLAKQLKEAQDKEEFAKFGPLKWRGNYGIYTELKFHEKDDPYYFELSKGIDHSRLPKDDYDYRKIFDPAIYRGKILFVPDITIFHKGVAMILIEVVRKNHLSHHKINQIRKFFNGHYFELYQVYANQIMSMTGSLENITFDLIHKG